MNGRHKTQKLTLSAMCSALSFVLMYVCSVTGIFDLTGIAAAGLVTLVLVIVTDKKYATLSVAVCSLLTLLLVPDKTIGGLYIMAGGIYPLVKPYLERRNRALTFIFKLAVWVLITMVYSLLCYLLLTAGEIKPFIIAVTVAIALVTAFLYDMILTKTAWIVFSVIYRKKM